MLKKVIACLALCLLAGCAKPADAGFMADLSKGLEARWQMRVDEAGPMRTNEFGTDEYMEAFKDLVGLELDALKPYEDKPFEDVSLKETAEAYIANLEAQQAAADKCLAGSGNYDEIMLPIHVERAELIAKFANEYGLTVSPEFQEDLDYFLSEDDNEGWHATVNRLQEAE